MLPLSGGKAQYVVDAVRAEEVMYILAVQVMVVYVTATHEEIAAFHTPAA